MISLFHALFLSLVSEFLPICICTAGIEHCITAMKALPSSLMSIKEELRDSFVYSCMSLRAYFFCVIVDQ